ncbi:MAG: SPASM domain-containing protein [Candidatus Eisenbacteria bacterium]|nr:SPASM domain-containing protein [Candidatus Eisenbacteria bacterium]
MRPSLQWQWRFLRDFLGGDRATAPPFALAVDVTQRCNLSCLHCRRHSPMAAESDALERRDFPLALFQDLCRQALEWGIRKIVLIGEGEPLLHPGLMEMICAAKTAGREAVMLTNGTLIDGAMASEFVTRALDELRFSLWASNVDEYRAQYPGTPPVFFDRALQGIRHSVAAKRAAGSSHPRIVVHRPIDPRFLHTLDATLKLAHEHGCDAVSFSPLKPLLPEDEERLLTPQQSQELMAHLERLKREAARLHLAHNFADLVARLKLGREVWRQLPCYIGRIDMRLRVSGDVVPCDTCNWVMGNAEAQSLRDIWNSKEYRAFRRLGREAGRIPLSPHGCLCDYCCHAITNQRCHRTLRWLRIPAAQEG